ncbi:MAG: hypothetical protein KDC35_16230 [Acidobacteria bacterium]|nr:hypothetical protein [Acidobacteriota bacterium]
MQRYKYVLLATVGVIPFFFLNTTPARPVSQKQKLHEEGDGPKQDQPAEAAAYWQMRLETPGNENPAQLNWSIKREVASRKQSGDLPPVAFEDYGPGNFGGRIRTIGVNRLNPDVMLVGGVNGGIWKTLDGGKSWAAKTDFLPNLAICSMVVDPDQPNRVFVGTGEGFFNFDAARGMGVFVSEDFGETWTHLSSTQSADFYYVNRLARIPGSNVLMAATRSGLFRSEDLGASWVDAAGFFTDSRGYVDLKVDPSNTQRVYAYHYGSSAAGSATSVTVNAPESLAGMALQAAQADFGGNLGSVGPITGDVVLAQDSLACSSLTNAAEISGKIALIDRGSCNFVVKVKNAQLAGAIAVIVVNNEDGDPITMGGSDATITIPAVMISLADGNAVKAVLDQGVNVTISESNVAQRFVARSTDGGASWQQLGEGQGIPTTNISRMEIGIGSDGVVYLSVSDDSSNPATRGLWKSTDGGQSFAKTASNASFIERQGWYDLMIGVDPSDSNRVFMGAVDVFRSTDGGDTIGKVSFWAPGPGQISRHIHADIHAIAFHPTNPSVLWIGTDGGIYKSSDSGNTFESLNHDLRIIQNYGIAAHPNGELVIGGTQDNGTHLYFGDKSVWLEWAGGDGGFCAWDQQEPDFVYGSTPAGGMYGSANGGSSIQGINLPDTAGALFIQPFTLDPNNGNRMLVGTNKVYYSENVRMIGSAQWTAASDSLGASVTATTFSPHQSSVAYAGTTAGRLYANTALGSGGQFSRVNGLPDTTGIVTWIEVDPHDVSGQTLYVTFSGYRENRVMKSTDGGASWTSIHGNLPDMPVHCLSVDPQNPDRVYLGTELGLWVTDDNGAASVNWQPFETGAAWTRIVQLHWADNGRVMWIGTHGRGTFRMTRDGVQLSLTNQQVEGDGDTYIDLQETHQLLVHLNNKSGFSFTSGQVTLTSSDPGLSITPGSMPVEQLAGQSDSTFVFEARLDSLAAPLSQIVLTATFTSNGHQFSQNSSFVLGADPNVMAGPFMEGAEAEGLMTHSSLIGEDDWSRVTSQALSGTQSWFSANIGSYADKSLETPVLHVEENDAIATFFVFYDLEGDMQQRWDGVVLEIETQDGWTDLGHQIIGAGYDGQLFNNNSLYLRDAWSGNQQSWREATVSLADYQGQDIRLRWRLGCDTSANEVGFWLDDIAISGVSWTGEPSPDPNPCSTCDGIRGSRLAHVAILPHAPSGSGNDTYVNIVNPNTAPVAVEVFGFGENGSVLGSWQSSLPANGSLWEAASGLWQGSGVSWIQVGSDLPVFVAAEFVGEGSRSAYAASETSDEVFLPHVAKNTALFETYIAAVNSEPISSQTELVPALETLDPVSLGEGHDAYSQLLVTATDLLGADIAQTDWAVVRSAPASVSAMEFFSVLPAETQVASLGLNTNMSSNVRFAHIAKDTGIFWTGMVYINVSATPETVTETYYGDDGAQLATRSMTLAPTEKVTLLYDANSGSEPVPSGAAWLDVQSTGDLIGYELFGAAFGGAHDFFAGLQGDQHSGTSLVFSHVESSAVQWTGLVALNVGDVAANLQFDLISADGTVKGTASVENVQPKTKTTALVNNLFPEASFGKGDWVRMTSSGSQFSGFALWGDQATDQRQNLSGLGAFIP